MMNSMPGMMNCRELEDFIIDYLDGNLSKGEELKFKAHLTLCQNCRQYINDYQAVVKASKDAMKQPQSLECEAMPESLVKAIMEASKKA